MDENGGDSKDEGLVRGEFKDKVRRTLGRVPFVEEACRAYFCAIDEKTPAHVKAVLVGALAYFIMPADMIPDFIAGLGYTDDAVVFWAAWRSISAHVTDEHAAKARRFLDKERAGN